jgi:sn-glycerol 3-phosphate transport system permease protein
MRNKDTSKIFPYLFLLPSLVVMGSFVFFPFIKTIVFSFTLTNSRGEAVEFVGFENYLHMFRDPIFLNSLKITLLFALMVGLPTFLVSFILAVLACDRSRGSGSYELMYSLPMAISSSPASIIWFQFFSGGRSGIINHLLGTDIAWLFDARFALMSVAFVTVWLYIGASFIFLLTGLRNVPHELIESSLMDGARYFKRLFRIIIPIASPQIFFVIFLNIISSFQTFAQIRLLTAGGPGYSTNVLVFSIYRAAINDLRYETAYAQSVILFLIILVITLLQFKAENRTVFYNG